MPLPLLPQGTLDFTGIVRDDVLTRLQSNFHQVNPDWDDYSVAFPENLILEGMTFCVDLVRGTMEERARQLSWSTVTDRLAAIRLGRLGNFTLSGASAATLSGIFRTPNNVPAAVAVPIPAGTRIRTGTGSSQTRYRTLTEVTLLVGTSAIAVNLEQAEEKTDNFESSNEPNLELLLNDTPYIDGSAIVSAANGNYSLFNTFLGAGSTTRAAVVLVDDAGQARVRFGTGRNGAIPQGAIQVIYKVGGGTAGEVEANTSWTVEDPLTDALGQPTTLVFNNAAASLPGTDALTVDEARVRGPLHARTNNRMVIEDDFETVATSVASIARAFMATSDDEPLIIEDTGRLEVVALGTKLASGRFEPAVPTEAKLAEIRALMAEDGDFPPVMGFTFDVAAATLRTVNVAVRVHKEANATASSVSAAIRAALADLFAVTLEDGTPNLKMNFGAKLLGSDGLPDFLIPWSDVFNSALDSAGVRYISSSANNLLLNGLHGSVSLAAREFPKLGTVTIFDEDQAGKQI